VPDWTIDVPEGIPIHDYGPVPVDKRSARIELVEDLVIGERRGVLPHKRMLPMLPHRIAPTQRWLGVLPRSARPRLERARRASPGGVSAWVGTITTEGDVTTVVNQAGSVWGGNATLVETLSIGIELGNHAYMLGRIDGIGVAEDRVFVLDGQVPIIRVYDMEGRHLADYGGEGEGPGEFRDPDSLSVLPDGRIFVRDPQAARINEYAADGAPVSTI